MDAVNPLQQSKHPDNTDLMSRLAHAAENLKRTALKWPWKTLQACRSVFSKADSLYVEAEANYTSLVHDVMAAIYIVGHGLRSDKNAWLGWKYDKFWEGFNGDKPTPMKHQRAFRYVVDYVLQTSCDRTRKKASKWACALETLYQEDVAPEQALDRIRADGIERLARAHAESKRKALTLRSDDIPSLAIPAKGRLTLPISKGQQHILSHLPPGSRVSVTIQLTVERDKSLRVLQVKLRDAQPRGSSRG